MRHLKQHKKLNRTASHRLAMLNNMVVALLKHEQITTTLPKAQTLRPYIERIITKARNNSLHVRRQLLAKLQDTKIVDKLMTTIAERYKGRPGGYTRIVKAGFRFGDAAPVGIIELVDRDMNAKGLEDLTRLEKERATQEASDAVA